MPDTEARTRSRNRTSGRAETSSEVVELRARLAGQAEVIEELRREVGWLTEELIARDSELAESGDNEIRTAPWTMFQGIRRLVHEHVPHGSRLVVASSGDEAFLRCAGYRAEHLSQDRLGGYVGGHPSCSRAAVVQLEAARWRGDDVLMIPSSDLWWLQHYPQFARHLERRYTRVVHEEEVGAIWDLRNPSAAREVHDLLAGLCVALARQPAILDWHTGQDLAACFDEYKVFSPIGVSTHLAYLDDTIDVVAVADTSAGKVAEARRVASALVIHAGAGAPPAMEVLWQSDLTGERSASVSIVVAARDGRPSTPNFTRLLFDTLPSSFAGEVLVDTACDAMVPQLGREAGRLKRIKVIRCSDGEGFPARVRRCAEEASGDVLIVLDGSTWPIAGWLPPLTRLLREGAGVGVVTGMLVEPDGCLVDHRSLLDPDHFPMGARSDDLDAARHTYVRLLDGAPPEFFATHRRLFLEWDQPQSEDQDTAAGFCAHVRSLGMSVVYQPETVAISSWRGGGIPTTEMEPSDG
jgi:hypothetical protein